MTQSYPLLNSHQKQQLWQTYQNQKPKKLIANLQRDLEPGWLQPYLFQIDNLLWGRWHYWHRCQLVPQDAWMHWQIQPKKDKSLLLWLAEKTLPTEPIPQIAWNYNSSAEKMLDRVLDSIPTHGNWRGWGAFSYLDYFLKWLLYGFGHPGYSDLPIEPDGCGGASMRLYQLFDLSYLLMFPYDYFGKILPEIVSKKGQRKQGFFPTPMNLSTMMAMMVNNDSTCKFKRVETFLEPCVGTGSLMLCQSNYTLCGIGIDIDRRLLECALVSFYLYAPWFACPIWWMLDRTDLICGDSLLLKDLESINTKHWEALWLGDICGVHFERTIDPSSTTLKQKIRQLQKQPLSSASNYPNNTVRQILTSNRHPKTYQHERFFK
jgi:hypothetical protein